MNAQDKKNNWNFNERTPEPEMESAKEQAMTEADEAANTDEADAQDNIEAESETVLTPEAEIEQLKEQVEKEKKDYVYLMAEFDNYRKRTLKEKSEIIKNAGENVLKGLLPILDDFERGLKATENTENAEAVREGMKLIYHKLVKYLDANGVKAIDPEIKDFDTNLHEAISAIPAPSDDLKGKILDTVEKGYMLNDKVLRHAKVVVAQ